MSNDVALQNSKLSIPLSRSATSNSRFSVNSQSMYGVKYGQAVVGQDFAPKINISSLAIESTAYTEPPPPPPAHRYDSPSTANLVITNDHSDNHSATVNSESRRSVQQANKLKRRVTFNMENVQVQTIPTYSSSDTSSDEIDDEDSSESDCESDLDVNITPSKIHTMTDLHPTAASPSLLNATRPGGVPQSIGRMSISSDPVYQPLLQKTGFWYPLNPLLKQASSLTNRESQYNGDTPLSPIKPLAVTEKLISDFIEREKRTLHLDTTTINSRRDLFIDGRSPASATFPSSPALSSDGVSSILICDSDDEEEQNDTIIRSRDLVSPSALRSKVVVHGKITDLSPKSEPIPLSIGLTVQTPNSHSASQLQTIPQLLSSNSNHKHNSENHDLVSLPPPKNQQNHNMHLNSQHQEENSVFSNPPPSLKTDFSKAIYNEFAKRHNQELIPLEEYEPPKLTFPFEQELIPLSAVYNNDEENSSSSDGGVHDGSSSISSSSISINDSLHDIESLKDPVWIDYTTSSERPQKSLKQATRKLFFVRVIKAENLDFPIENNDTHVYCSIRYKNNEIKSQNQKLRHTVDIDREMIIQDIDPNEEITITLHASMFSSTNAQPKNGSWYHKIKHGSIIASSANLERYIHDKDGSLCQTLLLPHRFMETEAQEQLATLMLVNSWYRQQHHSSIVPNSSVVANPTALLKRRSSSFLLRRKHSSAEANNCEATEKSTRATSSLSSVPDHIGTNSLEKAVGKLYLQCLYINVASDYIPSSMDEALEALNAKRFHETTWQTGYLTQLGGNAKHWSRNFFTLTGGSLFAYSENTQMYRTNSSALYEIPLTRAVDLICNRLIKASHQQASDEADTALLMSRLESMNDNMPASSQSNVDLEVNRHQQCPEDEFQLVFDNGTKIRFKSESAAECHRWVSVIEIMMCKLPPLPDWVQA